MTPSFRIGSAVALALLVGCTSESTPESAPETADAQAATDASNAEQQVWKSTSARVELSSFGYWKGSSGYSKDRADMSQEQLDALAGLRTIPLPDGPPKADFTSYTLRVIDQDGTSVAYRAVEGNIRGSDESASSSTLVTLDYGTFRPFLATIRCLAAKSAIGKERTTETPTNPTANDIASAVALPTDTGCTNGVFVPYGCSDSFFTLDVASPVTYGISSGRCLENLSLRAYSADGTTLVAESVAGTSDACFSLQHAFDAGKYILVLSKTNAAGCGTQGTAGDTSLRLTIVK
jgi:hypothetical protein